MDSKVITLHTPRSAGIDLDLAAQCGAPDEAPAPAKRIPPPFRGFTEADLNAAKLHPRCIVQNLLYADLALVGV